MKSFKEYITESKKGTYAAVRPDVSSAKSLTDLMTKHGVPNPEPADKLHSTLLYSRKNLPKYTPDTSISHESDSHKLEVWPTKSGKNCLVMKMNAPSLESRHKELMYKHKATYDYPEYKPHISLSYDIGDFDINKIKDIPKKMKFTNEYQEELDTSGK